MARRKTKESKRRAAQAGKEEEAAAQMAPDEKVPRTMMFARGKVNILLKRLVQDMRKMLLPFTALKLKVRSRATARSSRFSRFSPLSPHSPLPLSPLSFPTNPLRASHLRASLPRQPAAPNAFGHFLPVPSRPCCLAFPCTRLALPVLSLRLSEGLSIAMVLRDLNPPPIS
ncbi:unnamed protein product [Closterium sp. NIES-53]